MIAPQAFERDGKQGTIVFLDRDFQPVEPESDDAVVARALFEDGSTAVYRVEPKRTDLGDYEGHPFRGNQWTEAGGEGEKDPPITSKAKSVYIMGNPATDTSMSEANEVLRRIGGKDTSIHKVVNELTDKLEGQFDVTVNADDFSDTTYLTLRRARPDVELASDMVMQVNFKRSQGEKVMVVPWLRVDPDKRTTRDAFRAIEGMVEVAKQTGVKAVVIEANAELGGYAWARLGVTSEHPRELSRQVNERLTDILNGESLGEKHKEQEAVLKRVDKSRLRDLRDYATEHENNPNLPELLAKTKVDGIPVGRALLRGTSWTARIKPTDDKVLSTLRKFSGRKSLSYREKLALMLGDFIGHPFRGNQYTDVAGEGGGGGGPSTVARIHTSNVTTVLGKAGFSAFKQSKREMRSGFSVRQINPYTIAVDSAYALPSGRVGTTEEVQRISEGYERVLTKAGFKVTRPFGDKTLLAVRIPGTQKHLGDYPGHPFRGNQWTTGDEAAESVNGRTFTDEEGYRWHEEGPVKDWALGLSKEDRSELNSYASFSSREINRAAHGILPTRTEKIRDMTPEEEATYRAFLSDPTLDAIEDPDAVERARPRPPEGEGYAYDWSFGGKSVKGPVVDQESLNRSNAQADRLDRIIREKGYDITEPMQVNRSTYFRDISPEVMRDSVGMTYTEPGFSSTFVGTAGDRVEGYSAWAKFTSLHRRYGSDWVKHQDEPGTAVNLRINLPTGTRVAAIEATRQAERVLRSPKYEKFGEKTQRTEAELLLGRGAKYRIRSVTKGKKYGGSDKSMNPVQTWDVVVDYVGGGSSEGKRRG